VYLRVQTGVHRFPIQRRQTALYDQFVTRGYDTHDRFPSLDDAANGLEFDVNHSPANRSGHDGTLKDVSAGVQLFRYLSQFRADFLRISSNLIRSLRIDREDLQFGFTDLLA